MVLVDARKSRIEEPTGLEATANERHTETPSRVAALPHAKSLRSQASGDSTFERGPGVRRGADRLRSLAREAGGDLTHARFEGALRRLATMSALAARGGATLAPEDADRTFSTPSPRTFADRIAATAAVRDAHALSTTAYEALLEHGVPAADVHREAMRCDDRASLSASIARARTARASDPSRGGASMREATQYLRAWREGQPLGPKLRELHLDRLESPRTPPAMLFTELGLRDAVAEIARASRGPTLIIASPTNHEALRSLARDPGATEHGSVASVPVRAPSHRVMRRLLHRADREGIRTIIGVGGGVAQDVAKMVGLGRDVYIVPTVISSDCSSNGRSVVGMTRAFSCETSTPIAVIASIPTIATTRPDDLGFWTQSGFSDLLSELSAALDGPSTHGADRITARRALEWIVREFSGYDASALERLLQYVHEVGCDDIERGTNGDRVGGEHVLYKTLLEVSPPLRHRGTRAGGQKIASHGQICAIGTLLTSHLEASERGDRTLHARLHEAFAMLGVPLTWPELEAVGIRREDLVSAIERARSPVWPSSRIGRDPRLARDAGAVLDEIFGAAPPAAERPS